MWQKLLARVSSSLVLTLSAPYPVIVEKNVEAEMRDGVVLRADVYRPDAPGRFPALLKRTPYSKAAQSEIALFHRLASEGFVVSVQDTRGRYMSDGISVPHDEARDGADSVQWLRRLPYVDGKIGMFGGSYAATTQLTAASLRPEGLVALFPSSSYASRYDMVFQGGAFYLLDGLRWNLGQAVDVRRRNLRPDEDRDGPVGLTERESALVKERFVWHLPLKTMDVDDLRSFAPGYFEMLAHPGYDAFWKAFDIGRRHDNFDVPALHLTGWYDSLLVGTLANFEGLRARAASERARKGQRLIVGPWTHARPSADSRRIGDVDFGPEAGLDSEALMERWFRYWLQDSGEASVVADGPPVKLFIMGENRWRDEEAWPLSRATPTELYLRAGGVLASERPGDEAPDAYVYDPRDPVSTPSFAGYSRAPMDASVPGTRADVLVFTSAPLEAPVEVTGYVKLALWIASSARDTDFTGRLLDVAPDGRARALSEGILRARYRHGFERSELLTPGEPTEIEVALGATGNLFLSGHRIRLEVSSSNFPRFDRNPNTGGTFGEDSELEGAEQTIFHDRARPSRLVLPVVPRVLGEERSLETEFADRISRDRISEFHRRLTERPHRAGTEGAEAMATYLSDTLEAAGLDVQVHEYDAYLSSPRRVSVEIVEPVQEALDVQERGDVRDGQSFHAELEPGFIAYSASADVTADVVYAGYGLPADYDALDVDPRGKIVLARYGRSHRAVKVHEAEERGAVGILIYSDAADDGAGKGVVWPEGPWRAATQLQRGNAKLSWFWHGDPLTPGIPATANARRWDPPDAPTLPRIPAAPLSAHEAAKLLERLPGAVRVRMDVAMDDGLRKIRNVVATLEGRSEPDRWILLGTHHDAWTFGGVDPGSAASVLLETAYGLGSLARDGLRPARSIVFCFWDAEEYGLVGSTEFAEEHLEELREKAVVYINSDMYNGTRLAAGGTPSLRDFVREVSRDLPGVEPPEDLAALGSGADFVPFQDFVGLPTLSLEFLSPGGWGFGTYHSNFDDRYWMLRHGDDDFRQGAVLARLLGTTALRLAEAPVLPYRFSYYGEQLEEFVGVAEGWGAGKHRFDDLRELAEAIREKSKILEARLGGLPAEAARSEMGRALNDRLMRLEQTLVDETEPADERWYRHVVYGWNIYALYSGQPFPGLAAAIERGGEADVAREHARLRRALARLASGLDEALQVF